MSVRKLRPDDSSAAATRLGLEADATLRDDPQLLCDPRRLGSLHARLQAALGAAEAETVLLEVGFLQGLRDGERAVAALARTERDPGEVQAPRLALAVAPQTDGEWVGAWRDGFEAQGRLASLGRASAPACALSAGYTSGWLSVLFGEDLLALETECCAAGGERCAFRVRPASAWLAGRDRRAQRCLSGLDFAALRAAVAPPSADEDEGDVDSNLPVVHVWGPVMVLPFSGTEDSISAIDLIRRDRNARDVSVVVVDLGGAILDDGLGAFALERVIEAIEEHGADAVLAGVSPRSQAVVSRLADPHRVVHGELAEAIATAFQIADARRRGAA